MKKFLFVLMTATIALSSTIVSLAGEWRQTGQGWSYDNGKPVLLPDSDNSGGLVIYNKVCQLNFFLKCNMI